MFDLIPSLYMRKLFAEKGFELTDRQKATLIWNAPRGWEERMSSLNEHMKSINDEKLRKQIMARIDFENTMLQRFMENDTQFVYVVCEDTWGNAGYFRDFQMAKSYALKFMEENGAICQIEKQHIVSSEENLTVKSNSWWNPYLFGNHGKSPWEIENVPYDGRETASITLERNGQIKSVFSSEMSLAENMSVEYNSDRFEMKYFEIPFEATVGTPVKLTYSSDNYDDYGILLTDTSEWNDFLRSPHFKDFSDIAVTVFYLTEQGLWSHEHISPLYLDFDVRPEATDEKGKAYIAAMKALSDYLLFCKDQNDEYYFSRVIETAENYRDICFESSIRNRKHPLEYAKRTHNIII